MKLSSSQGRKGNPVKELWRKWDNISLIKRIVVGLIIGAILGVTCGTVPGLSDVLTHLRVEGHRADSGVLPGH